MNELKAFVKARDEMLLKGSIDELRSFVEAYRGLYDENIVRGFLDCSDEVAEITLHKMISGAINLPFEYRMNSVAWLTERGHEHYA